MTADSAPQAGRRRRPLPGGADARCTTGPVRRAVTRPGAVPGVPSTPEPSAQVRTGADYRLGMAIAFSINAAQLRSSAREQYHERVPLSRIDGQPVLQLYPDHPIREPCAVSGRHPLGCVPRTFLRAVHSRISNREIVQLAGDVPSPIRRRFRCRVPRVLPPAHGRNHTDTGLRVGSGVPDGTAPVADGLLGRLPAGCVVGLSQAEGVEISGAGRSSVDSRHNGAPMAAPVWAGDLYAVPWTTSAPVLYP